MPLRGKMDTEPDMDGAGDRKPGAGRLYSDDQLAESQVPYLGRSMKHNFEEAQNKRLEMLLKETKNRNLIRVVRRKLDDSLIYLKSKNATDVTNKIRSSSQMLVNKLSEWSAIPWFLLGIIIGAMLFPFFSSYLANNAQFLHYILLAVLNYDGQIPEPWLGTVKETPINITETEEQTMFSLLIDILSLYQ